MTGLSKLDDDNTVRHDDAEIDRLAGLDKFNELQFGELEANNSRGWNSSIPDGAAFIIVSADGTQTTVSSNWTVTQIAKAQELLETIDEAYRQQRTRKVFDRFWNKNIKPVLTSLRDSVESPETK